LDKSSGICVVCHLALSRSNIICIDCFIWLVVADPGLDQALGMSLVNGSRSVQRDALIVRGVRTLQDSRSFSALEQPTIARWMVIEQQRRGQLHVHGVCWLQGAGPRMSAPCRLHVELSALNVRRQCLPRALVCWVANHSLYHDTVQDQQLDRDSCIRLALFVCAALLVSLICA
jgi:hypothetical protein